MDATEVTQDPWLTTLSVAMAVAMAAWTFLDARELENRGASVWPGLWALMVVLVCGIGLPVYLTMRLMVWRRQVDDLTGEDDWPK